MLTRSEQLVAFIGAMFVVGLLSWLGWAIGEWKHPERKIQRLSHYEIVMVMATNEDDYNRIKGVFTHRVILPHPYGVLPSFEEREKIDRVYVYKDGLYTDVTELK